MIHKTIIVSVFKYEWINVYVLMIKAMADNGRPIDKPDAGGSYQDYGSAREQVKKQTDEPKAK